MNSLYRKALSPSPAQSQVDFFDTRAAVEALKPGAYQTLPYTARILAENLVRRCPPEQLSESLLQIIERKRDLDFPWYPARVVCHDILGQTALVDLAGLRDAIAEQGGDPAQVNPVVETQLIVDHSLAVEYSGCDPDAFEKKSRSRRQTQRRSLPLYRVVQNRVQKRQCDPCLSNGIMHQINLEKMSLSDTGERGRGFP
ncbi:aconitase family protein [Vibrio cholerae]